MDMFQQPWRLVPNRVRGQGGRELDTFRNITPPVDDAFGSESWVGSATRAAGFSGEAGYRGCSEALLPGGGRAYLVDLIDNHPLEILGEAHYKRHGKQLGVLVKLLDAKEAYGFQAHPRRDFAKRMWNSDFGKEECWYVLATREDAKTEPSVLLGFKENVTREQFAALYEAGDQSAIAETCHRIPAKPGDAFFVGGGVPHALGEGCFVIEVQEPSDITVAPLKQDALIRLFSKFAAQHADGKSTPAWTFPREDDAVYDEKVLGCFQYDGMDYETNLKRCKIPRQTIREGDWGSEAYIIGPEQTAYFSCTQTDVNGEIDIAQTDAPQIAIVTRGEGSVLFEGGELPVRRGDELFFPYRVASPGLRGDLSVVFCHPEGAKAR